MTQASPTRRDFDRRVIIVSNRGPVKFERGEDGETVISRSSGGLVTALSGLTCQLDVTWLCCAQTQEDADWGSGLVKLQDGDCQFNVHFLIPDENAYDGYYNVIANPLLWFLQHSMWDAPRRPVIDRATWDAWENGYKSINRMFASEIAQLVRKTSQPTLVMLQDYHLYLVGKNLNQMLRRRERPTTIHFIHIPWPGAEYWGILPATMRQEILTSLCAEDMLGFQTREDGLNFLRTCESYLPGCNVSYKRGRIWYRNHATYVKDFPISIDVAQLQEIASGRDVAEFRDELVGMIGERKLILRIDRIEPSKNIIRGFQAFEEMLELYPEQRGKVVFLALLVPSRMDVDEYQDYMDELMAMAGRVNAHFGSYDWEPIRVLVGENYHKAIAALQLYDVLLVNAIADGMNLVAKEGPIVNQRNGVLVLSERAGARQQLESGAIIISPCDVYATAEAMHNGLMMPAQEREERARRLQWIISRSDIRTWLSDQLDTVTALKL